MLKFMKESKDLVISSFRQAHFSEAAAEPETLTNLCENLFQEIVLVVDTCLWRLLLGHLQFIFAYIVCIHVMVLLIPLCNKRSDKFIHNLVLFFRWAISFSHKSKIIYDNFINRSEQKQK